MCVLPNHQFYFYILTVSSALLCAYILCNLYNLVRQQQHSDQRPPQKSFCYFLLNGLWGKSNINSKIASLIFLFISYVLSAG